MACEKRCCEKNIFKPTGAASAEEDSSACRHGKIDERTDRQDVSWGGFIRTEYYRNLGSCSAFRLLSMIRSAAKIIYQHAKSIEWRSVSHQPSECLSPLCLAIIFASICSRIIIIENGIRKQTLTRKEQTRSDFSLHRNLLSFGLRACEASAQYTIILGLNEGTWFPLNSSVSLTVSRLESLWNNACTGQL